MTVREWLEFVFLMALAAAVAAFGEPRTGGLIVGGAAALTIMFAASRRLDR